MRRRIAITELHHCAAVAGQILPVGVVVLGGVVAAGLEARAVRLVGEAETDPEVVILTAAEKEGQHGIKAGDRHDSRVSKRLLLILRHSQKIGAVNLDLARALLRLEDQHALLLDVHEHDGSEVRQAGVIVEVVVFAIVGGRRLLRLGEEQDIAGF